MGFEPTTTTLATWCSTPELLPPESRRPSSGLPHCVACWNDATDKEQYKGDIRDCKRATSKLPAARLKAPFDQPDEGRLVEDDNS
jgi:hypothetical protein